MPHASLLVRLTHAFETSHDTTCTNSVNELIFQY